MTAAEKKKEIERLKKLIENLDPKSPSTAQKRRRYKNKIADLSKTSGNRRGAFSRENLQVMQKAQTAEGRAEIAAEKKKKQNTGGSTTAAQRKKAIMGAGYSLKKKKKPLEVTVKGAGAPAYPKQGGKGGSTTARQRRKAIEKAGYNVSKKRKHKEFGAMTDYMNANFNRRK